MKLNKIYIFETQEHTILLKFRSLKTPNYTVFRGGLLIVKPIFRLNICRIIAKLGA